MQPVTRSRARPLSLGSIRLLGLRLVTVGPASGSLQPSRQPETVTVAGVTVARLPGGIIDSATESTPSRLSLSRTATVSEIINLLGDASGQLQRFTIMMTAAATGSEGST